MKKIFLTPLIVGSFFFSACQSTKEKTCRSGSPVAQLTDVEDLRHLIGDSWTRKEESDMIMWKQGGALNYGAPIH